MLLVVMPGMFVVGMIVTVGMRVNIRAMGMDMRMLVVAIMVMIGIGIMVIRIVRMSVAVFAVGGIVVRMIVAIVGVVRRLRVLARVLDNCAADAIAMPAPAGVAMPRTAAARAVFRLFLGFAMGAFIGLDQGLTVGDRNLVVVGMDFAEGEEAVTVSTVFDERGLQRRLDARDLGEIDVAAQLLALGGFEIKFLDAIAADHDDPGLFRVGGIDQHFVGHLGALGGGGRAGRRAHAARPGDATVHLIRG
jgi:hypothetical protein